MRPTRPEGTHCVAGERAAVPGLALLLVLLLAAPPASADPWRLDAVFAPGERVTLTASQRTRYSRLYNQFRPLLGTGDEALSLRTLLHMRLAADPFILVAELQDSRALLTDTDSAVTPGIVNTVEPIQTYVGYRFDEAFSRDGSAELWFGRQTFDIGSRRLVARNRFRNGIQSYTGMSGWWKHVDGSALTAFYVLPAIPRPFDLDGLLDNEIRHDDYDGDLRLLGVHFQRPDIAPGVNLDLSLFGLGERDDPAELETRNRKLLTAAVRFYRPPLAGQWDFDFENALQTGRRRATFAPNDNQSLDVFARFHHLQIGYSFAMRWSPHLAFEADLATGDDDPADGDYGRYDTLFGASRADFGPTDFYGLLGRENLRSLGLRLTVQPSPRGDAFLALRSNWLDAPRDVFARSGVRDPAGASGRFGGQQIELRARYWLVPKLLQLESGATLFLQGEFMRNAPNATGHGDPFFIYGDFTFTF